jgi:CP family cyanate transporter-like MFS transporter
VKAALRWYLPLAIVAVTLNLRPALLTPGLVLPALQQSLQLSPFGAGALTALPILALAFASAIAVPVGRRFGWSGGLVIAMVLIAAGVVLRSAGSDATLYSGALVLGIGIGLGNVFVPTLVKARLAGRIGLAMGLYTMMLTFGALISTSLTPLLFARFGDWRPTLAVWAIPAAAAAVIALPLLTDNMHPQDRVAGMGFWRNRLAWAVSSFMGLQSGIFYAIALWLGPLLVARGVPLHDVAFDLTLFYFTQFLSALVTPVILTKIRRQDVMAVLITASNGALVAAVLYGPHAAIGTLSGLLGLTMGAMFAVALTFQVLRARTHDTAARLSSMALFVGYGIASFGPLVMGLVNRLPDARLASTLWIAALIVLTMIAGALAGRQRFVDDGARATRADPPPQPSPTPAR